VKVYKGWGAFAELCEYLIPDVELAIEKLTGKSIPLSYDLSDKILLGKFPDEYLYALKRVAAHLQMKGKLPSTSFVEDLETFDEDEELLAYIDGYKKGFKYGSLVFFSETVGVYLPLKGLEEPIHFEHEDKSVEMCSIGSLYALRENLKELKELLEKKADGKFDESIPWHVEREIVNKLLGWTEEAIKEQKPLVLVGE
jgi:hypothetical protein